MGLHLLSLTSRRFLTNCCDNLRSEEHTSELQSQSNLVCRLVLEKKKRKRAACCLTTGPSFFRTQPLYTEFARSHAAVSALLRPVASSSATRSGETPSMPCSFSW